MADADGSTGDGGVRIDRVDPTLSAGAASRGSPGVAGEADKAGVIAPPPAIAVIVVMLAAALEHLVPSGGFHLLGFAPRLVVGAAIVLGGLALARAGERRFAGAGTEVMPWRPATALVTDGIYRRLRNPMYVGLGVTLVGLAIAFDSVWMLVLIVPAGLVLHYGVVLREERYLTRKFGEPYRRFMAEVPRYGWPRRRS